MNETHKRKQRSREIEMARVGELIAQGYTLPAIALKRGLPDIETLRRWLAENETLRDAYEQARDLRNEQLADDAVALADALADTNNAGLKLRIDARKWRAGLNQKDEKKADKKDEAKESLERLQRALERVRKEEEAEISRRQATEDKPDDRNTL